jgi:hypothetical protein
MTLRNSTKSPLVVASPNDRWRCDLSARVSWAFGPRCKLGLTRAQIRQMGDLSFFIHLHLSSSGDVPRRALSLSRIFPSQSLAAVARGIVFNALLHRDFVCMQDGRDLVSTSILALLAGPLLHNIRLSIPHLQLLYATRVTASKPFG